MPRKNNGTAKPKKVKPTPNNEAASTDAPIVTEPLADEGESTAQNEEVKEIPSPVAPVINPEIVEVVAETATSFTLTASQDDPDTGKAESAFEISFELNKDKETKVDFILGTAFERLFATLDAYKAAKVRAFDTRKPLKIVIASEHMSIDLGVIKQQMLQTLKVNSGVRSRLAFLDRVMIYTNLLLAPVNATSANRLHADCAQAVQLRFPNAKTVGLLPTKVAMDIAKTDLVTIQNRNK